MNHSNQVEVPKEYVETSVKTLFKKFANQRDVSLVYGDPIEVGLMKVVPVAKVSYGFGGGGDGAGNEGGGGSFKINPIGVYEITPESATFKPVRNNSSLPGIIISILSFGLFIYVRKMSTKKSR